MAALSADRNTPQMGQGVPQRMSYPVKTGVTIYKGALVVIDTNGYAKPGVAAVSTDICVGCATTQVAAGSASSGTYSVEVVQGTFKWALNGSAATIANVGDLVYVYNDQTVTLSSTSASIAGTLYQVDSDGVWVYSGLAAPIDGTTVSSLASDVSTVTGIATAAIGVPVCIPVVLATATSQAVVGRFKPGVAGKIARMEAMVTTVVSTAAKLATFIPKIAGTAVSGANVLVTSASGGTLGARITGSTVSGTNTFGASDEITIVADTVTTFAEGAILLNVYMQSA